MIYSRPAESTPIDQGDILDGCSTVVVEHLARHFADTYSRIGLPMPYETD